MFEQTFNNLDNVLRQEAGCTTELDYTEQTSWMLFLKYLYRSYYHHSHGYMTMAAGSSFNARRIRDTHLIEVVRKVDVQV